MLPEYIRAKRLLVQAPMAIPNWGARRHGYFNFRAICAMRDGRFLLLLPVESPFCIRASLFDFSENSFLQRMPYLVFVCTLSHPPQFAPRRAKGLYVFWRMFNRFCIDQSARSQAHATLARLTHVFFAWSVWRQF